MDTGQTRKTSRLPHTSCQQDHRLIQQRVEKCALDELVENMPQVEVLSANLASLTDGRHTRLHNASRRLLFGERRYQLKTSHFMKGSGLLPVTSAYPFNVLAQFLCGVVGVGDSDGDHSTDELDACPQFERLAPYQLFALRSHDRRTMSLALASTQVLTSEPQPRTGLGHAE